MSRIDGSTAQIPKKISKDIKLVWNKKFKG